MDSSHDLTRDLKLKEKDRFIVNDERSYDDLLGSFLPLWEPVVIRKVRNSQYMIHERRMLFAKRKLVDRLGSIWAGLSHPNILPLYGFVSGGQIGPLPCFVTPFIPEGTLEEYVKTHPKLLPSERFQLTAEIALGVHYLHDQTPQISHGDLAPHNVLVTHVYNSATRQIKAQPLIFNFGIPQAISEERLEMRSSHTLVHNYCAWEFKFIDDFRRCDEYKGQLICRDSGSMLAGLLRADVWAWALLALLIFLGREPIEGIGSSEPFLRWHEGLQDPCEYDLSLCEQNGMTPAYHQTMKACWNWNPKKRPRVSDVLRRLGLQEHPVQPAMKSFVRDAHPPVSRYHANRKPVHFFVRASRPSCPDPARTPPLEECAVLEKGYIVAVTEAPSDGWWMCQAVMVKGSEGYVDLEDVEIDGIWPSDPASYFSVTTVHCSSLQSKDALAFKPGKRLFIRSRGNDKGFWGFEPLSLGNITGRILCSYVDTKKYEHITAATPKVFCYAKVIETYLPGTVNEPSQGQLQFRQNDIIGVLKAPKYGQWTGALLGDRSAEGTFSRDAVHFL